MKTKYSLLLCAAILFAVLVGCQRHATISLVQNKPSAISVEQEKHSTNSIKQEKKAQIYPEYETTMVCCWCVVHDEAGNHGYAFWDASRNSTPPGGAGIYATIEEACKAIQTQHPNVTGIVPENGSHAPPGWEIRRLNDQEMSFFASKNIFVRLNMYGP
ncbi:MAG: hypothetical protein JWR26_2538 [Pedosphaera sp.]|nr:hypothetical protein [Pedosphaera sp.]